MAAIQWTPVPNALTTPRTHSIRFVSRGSAGTDDIAADIALRHPNFSKADILTILNAEDEAVMGRLLDGEQVTKEGSFSYFPSFTGRLDSPDDPLPPLDECLHLSTRVSAPFLEHLRREARTERLPVTEKLPVITVAEDTVLGLRDVLRSDGMLRLTGDRLFFDRSVPGSGECVLAGTESGSIVQTRLLRVEPGEIMFMPEIPAQAHPWNNEYTVSVTTRYTEHGTPRTGIYGRMLRSPLSVPGLGQQPPPETGILTGSAAAPYVSVIGGSVSADESLRIQAVLDVRQDLLLFSLLDMHEDGRTGETRAVSADGEQTLPGFSGSAVSSLMVRVDDYAALKELIRNSYGGRLVDVLEVTTA